MKKLFALVTARSTSTRLPNKCFALVDDHATLIEAVIRRAKKMNCTVVLCTSEDPSDDQLEAVAKKEGIQCFRGALKNKIHRWAHCFRKFDIDYAMLVDGDDPTFEYNVGKRALNLLQTADVDFVKADSKMTPGFITYGISRQGIEKLLTLAPNKESDTDVITRYIEHAQLKTAIVQSTPEEQTGHEVRLTVDYPEDVEFYRAVHKKVDYLAPGPRIVEAALTNGMQKLNWFRQDEFLKNQQAFNERVTIG